MDTARILANGDLPPWWVAVLYPSAALVIALLVRNPRRVELLLQSNVALRCTGVVTIALGASAIWIFVYVPVTSGIGRSPTLIVPRGTTAIGTCAVFVGCVLLATGRGFHRFLTTHRGQPYTALQAATLILAIIIAMAAEIGLHFWLAELGYRPH